ncbi:NADH-quinone oxidoreductase subunit NuoN [Tessaracoccus rhinocerotis]|uniref:NADH-quinone oxidoreductase subunit N n=1 Tax=Tessaracoccus rhinocerotis TaxID=1689449 RepID=A0A553K5I3_9ACTN|nr:NADH-quinone oxidoreductase subunit NuoN [Tessaracoccus rhinocerotis]TRY19967.1 NADH-quinone oxidoreductase subunit NuoN [Tessaracoccus rhinocerotis]
MSTILEITAPTLEWLQLSPLLVLLGAGAVGVLVEAFVPRTARYAVQVFIAGLAVVAALGLTINNWVAGETGIAAMGSVVTDGPTYVFWTMLLVFGLGGVALFAERGVGGGQSAFAASAATVPGSPLEREAERLKREHTEVFPLLVFALFGMLLFVASNDLLILFVALEILSLPLYLLSGMARRRRLLSQEAALKYFLLGAFASGFFLFGAALLYGYSGSFELGAIADAITEGTSSNLLLLAGMVLLAVGLLFKIGAVPFHAWTPDVYVGAPTPVTGFMAIATKTAAVGALLRIFYVALGAARWDWQPLLTGVAIATMLVGSVVALVQTDVKRLLAYSSIAHAGFILVGAVGVVAAAEDVSLNSVGSIAFYLLAYGFATLGAFAIVTMVRRSGGEANHLNAWRGLGRSHPVVATVMTLFLLSFAGIPPTAGFVGKLAVFAAAWAGGYGWLVFLAVVFSLVAAFLYLKIVVAMWFQDPVEGETAEVATPSLWTWCVLVVAALATIVLGILPGGLLELFNGAAEFIR